ncbi:ribonuclease Z, mitochondrial isoform X2 [Aricia agestis]|nr:ribonuclease Z, mitochondrial isoform X2 [Aricia agestis]
MPKVNTGRIVEAQKQRQTIAKKSEKYGPSTVYLQVLGSGARGVPNTLYLFTDQKRYLFNCGECTQRLAHEHKVKLSRLEHIFITSKTWRNIGGLPGLSLTLQDVGVPNITLHGPEGLDELYKATKRFVIMKEMNVNMAECTPASDFEDNAMNVKYVLMGPNEILNMKPAPAAKKVKREEQQQEVQFEEFINDDTDYYRRDSKGQRRNSTSKPNERGGIIDKTEKVLQGLQMPAESCVAYICTIKKRLGTLDLEKCVDRGVKPGPMLGQLKSGQDVVLPDGTVVRSVDVKTPDDPGPVFIVLEVPDISYLREEEFSAHFDNSSNPAENIPSLMVHYTPQHVIDHPKYQAFMAMFGTTTKHLVLNSHNSCLGSEAVHRSQHKLHLLDADIFPLLRDNSIPAVWTPTENKVTNEKQLEELKNKIALAQFQSIAHAEPQQDSGRGLLAGRTLAAYHLRPKKEWDTSAGPKLVIQDYIQEAFSVDGFSTSLERFKQEVESIRASRAGREYPKVVFMGTGSCIPSKTRNTSGILLQIDENRSMLLDCGEGTFGQIVRFFGPKRVNSFLRTLRAVYVSHLHADHHIGLIGVLQARREAFLEVNKDVPPLYLLAPGQIMSWLTMYDQQFEKIRGDFMLIPNQNLLESKDTVTEDTLTPALLADIGVRRVVTCLVAHCPNAFGVAVHLPDHKITYSGDTIPCEDLVNIGMDSTLLIHEATMEDELAQEARAKMHSTTSQAIHIGSRMRANFTLLTHFSQRYARLPRISQHMVDKCNVGIAFDNMQVSMSDLHILPHMYAPLQLIFADHCVELEQKAAQRAKRQERRASSPNVSPGMIRHFSTAQIADVDQKETTDKVAIDSTDNKMIIDKETTDKGESR